MKRLTFCVAIVAVLACEPAAFAQAPEPVKRTVFQKIDYPGARFATLLISIDGAPNFVVVKNVLEVAPEFGTG